MPYVIKYKTIVDESPCGVTLRGVFEDGRYFGDIVVYNRFSFSIEGYFSSTCVKSIFESVLFLKNREPIDADGPVDCWIADFPVRKQNVFFHHYVSHEYESETKYHHSILINLLKNEFDDVIQNKICEHKK